MRVSVIVAAYNVCTQIQRALESVRAQTIEDWEVIVVDDASTDGTPYAVAAIAEIDSRIRLIIQEENRGPAAARNRGIAEARGAWVAVLDADDAWRAGRLERLLAIADRTEADFVADNLVCYDDHQRCETGPAFEFPAEAIPFSAETLFSRENPWDLGILKPMIQRRVFAETGLGYDEGLRFGEDFQLAAELLFSGACGVLSGVPFYIYTTPIGHFSGARSTGTRSTTSLESLLAIVDRLDERYRDRITPEIARGMERCRRRIRQRLVAREITRLRQAGRLPDLTFFLIGHPRGAVRYLMRSRRWQRTFGSIAG